MNLFDVEEDEVWKPVKGFEGVYSVSNLGRIKRLVGYGSSTERILKLGNHSRGYKSTVLSKHGCGKSVTAHSIVAYAFLEKPIGATDVHHINGNKEDNRVCNLMWTTHAENIAFSVNEQPSSAALLAERFFKMSLKERLDFVLIINTKYSVTAKVKKPNSTGNMPEIKY